MNERERKILETVQKEVKEATINVPSSHGWPHLQKVGEIASYLAKKLGFDPFISRLAGLVHDLRFFDEEERKIRKIQIDAKHTAGKSALEILEGVGVSEEEKIEILEAILEHSKLPDPNSPSTLLVQILRDADRCSRQGYAGLLSILEANHFYGRPFYNEGGRTIWTPFLPLLKHEEIESAVDDVHDCMWWSIMETKPGKALYWVMNRVNIRFLENFEEFRRNPPEYCDFLDYDYWIYGLRNCIETSIGNLVGLRQKLVDPDTSESEYESIVTFIEDPYFI